MEVYLSTSIEACIQRDPKGLYKKAIKGDIKYFTGISPEAPYEPPLYFAKDNDGGGVDIDAHSPTSSSYLEIDTADGGSVDDHVQIIVNKLKEIQIL